jgi:hypothetical protein
MSYRRKKEAAKEKQRFEDLKHNNRKLIEELEIPFFIMDDYHNFLYFLMHGSLWPGAPINFNIDDFDSRKRELWREFVDKYFEVGFDDPGLGCLPGEDQQGLAKKYPKQFSWIQHAMDKSEL